MWIVIHILQVGNSIISRYCKKDQRRGSEYPALLLLGHLMLWNDQAQKFLCCLNLTKQEWPKLKFCAQQWSGWVPFDQLSSNRVDRVISEGETTACLFSPGSVRRLQSLGECYVPQVELMHLILFIWNIYHFPFASVVEGDSIYCILCVLVWAFTIKLTELRSNLWWIEQYSFNSKYKNKNIWIQI